MRTSSGYVSAYTYIKKHTALGGPPTISVYRRARTRTPVTRAQEEESWSCCQIHGASRTPENTKGHDKRPLDVSAGLISPSHSNTPAVCHLADDAMTPRTTLSSRRLPPLTAWLVGHRWESDREVSSLCGDLALERWRRISSLLLLQAAATPPRSKIISGAGQQITPSPGTCLSHPITVVSRVENRIWKRALFSRCCRGMLPQPPPIKTALTNEPLVI